jgi:magnesium transporter
LGLPGRCAFSGETPVPGDPDHFGVPLTSGGGTIPTLPFLDPIETRLLAARDWRALANRLGESPAGEVGDLLETLSDEGRCALFLALPWEVAFRAFPYLPRGQRGALLSELSLLERRALMAAMPPDERIAVLEDLPPPIAEELIAGLSPEELAKTRRLLDYPPNSVGRLMTPDVLAVRAGWTVRQTLKHLRRTGEDAETLDLIYVVDEAGHLRGDLTLRRLVLTHPSETVDTIVERDFLALRATDDREHAVRAMKAHDRVALPVVDESGVLQGIVTVDDVLDVAEEIATEDFQKLGGMQALDAPYLRVGLPSMVRKRAGWLAVLFLGETLTATAMGFFEHEIARAVVLALFVPLIVSSGGNSGSQATSLIIRAMALGEVSLRHWARVILREAPTGLVLGAILGLLGLVRVVGWQLLGFSDFGEFYFRIALTVALSLIGVVTLGTLAGSLLPFLMRRLGFDPASASAPFVATLVDVSGLVLYFMVANLTLRGALL